LYLSGHTDKDPRQKLKEQNINRISDVFLAVCDSNDKITSYKKIKNKPDRDMFQ
jgi:uncharacterized membrane protein YcaP (DUF421 family)